METWTPNVNLLRNYTQIQQIIKQRQGSSTNNTASSSSSIVNTTTSLADMDIIVDARSKERFNGSAPEPRAGIVSGHMPTSKNVPFGIFN